MRTAFATAIALALNGAFASAQIYRVAEMNTEQLRALDRTRTVVLLPGGILEQHGPYLPSFADGYMSERLTATIAEAIVARAGWKVLVFPLIPLGVGGANEIGGKYTFDGSYTVRSATLRAVFMDLATELGEGGVRRISSELIPKAQETNWPGYLGSPRHARVDIGAAAVTSIESTMADLALRILDGFDYRQLPRYGEVTKNDPGNASIDRGVVAHEQECELKQAAWLKKKGLR